MTNHNPRETPDERTVRIIKEMSELKRQFKTRVEAMEHEQVVRLMGLFDEFRNRASAIRTGKASE